MISLITGIIAVIIALKANSILGILLFFGQLYTSAVAVPFFFGLFFNDKSPRMFWGSSLLGIGTYLLIYLIAPDIEDGIFLISMSVSVISYLLLSKNKYSNFISKIKSFIIREGGEKSINLPIKKLGCSILPISVAVFFSDASFSQKQMVEISVVIVNLLLISVEIIYAEKMKCKNIIYSFAFWYCFPVFSMYLYFSETNFILFTFLFPMTLILSLVFYKWEKILINLLSAYIVALLLLLTLNRFDSNLLVSKLDLLAYMLFYIAGLSYFIIKPKEEGMKKIIKDIKANFISEKKEAINTAVNEYINHNELMQNHKKEEEKFLKYREIMDDRIFNTVLSEVNSNELFSDLKNYFELIFKQNNIQFSFNKPKEDYIKITCTSELIYTLVYSLTNFFAYIRDTELIVSSWIKEERFYVKYKIQLLEIDIKEVENYITKKSLKNYMLSLETIKSIADENDSITLKQFKDSIVLSVMIDIDSNAIVQGSQVVH